jgi:hypothetical protein
MVTVMAWQHLLLQSRHLNYILIGSLKQYLASDWLFE